MSSKWKSYVQLSHDVCLFGRQLFPHSGLQKASMLQILRKANKENVLFYLRFFGFGLTFFYRLLIKELSERAKFCYIDVFCFLYSFPFPFAEGQIATIRWRIYDNSQSIF